MKAERIVIVVAVLAAGYLMFRTSPQAKAKVTAGGHASNGDGTTVDAQGNYWYRGQMIYQAPKQEWSI